jgi:hypothetical protein
MRITDVERSFGELLAAVGDVVVARTRGSPATSDDPSIATLVRRYRSRRRAFDPMLDDVETVAGDDARALENMRAALVVVDGLEPTPSIRATAWEPAPEGRAVARARARLYADYGTAAESIRFRGETIHRLTALNRLATEPDATTRRQLFESMTSLWRAVDGDGDDASPYRRLLQVTAARWADHGSPIDANAAGLGLAGSLEGALHDILAAWRAVGPSGRIEPWDYRFMIGAAARRLDRLVPVGELQPLNDRYLAALGADPTGLGISYDILPRPDRPPVATAFTIGMGAWAADQPPVGPWTPRPPWVFATYAEGGIGNLLELLHESGHAIQAAGIRTRPAYLEFPDGSSAFLEGTADVLGWDVDEPDWQRHWLGDKADRHDAVMSRYGAVMLDVCWALFEIELHRNPSRRPNDVWTEVTADGLGIEPHPEWSWWAVRGQLIDGPGYLANYALSAIMAAAVRARIAESRGSWFEGDPGWYRFVADALFVAGASRPPGDLLESFLGGPLTAEALLADLRRSR